MVWTYNPIIDVKIVIPIGSTDTILTAANIHLKLKNVFDETIVNNPTSVRPPTGTLAGEVIFSDVAIDLGVTTFRAYIATEADLDAAINSLEFVGNNAVKRIDNATEVLL